MKRNPKVLLISLCFFGASLVVSGLLAAISSSEEVVPRETPEATQPEPGSVALQEPPQEEIVIPEWTRCQGPGVPVDGLSTPVVDTCAEPEPEPEPVFVEPAHIIIDAIDVDHPIIDVGLNPDRTMEIPHDVNELGWYEPGVKPGELGSAVIAGHVDSREQGPGAFFDLRYLEPSDTIIITDIEGNEQTWNITDIKRYDKDEAPLEEIFRWGGDTRELALITCGGEFDRTARSYQDNIVVYAELAE